RGAETPHLPQGSGGGGRPGGGAVPGVVPAAVQPGLQPDRGGLRQAQGAATAGGGADGGGAVGAAGPFPGRLQGGGMSQLLPPLRVCGYTLMQSALTTPS